MPLVIWKYSIPLGRITLEMPQDSKILHVALQNDTICLWALVEPTAKKSGRTFQVVGTGHLCIESDETYLGTVQIGQFVWHVFELE